MVLYHSPAGGYLSTTGRAGFKPFETRPYGVVARGTFRTKWHQWVERKASSSAVTSSGASSGRK